jgi:hypothetical protein
MSTSTLTPRQSFRETVALVAARAKEKLPQAVNGRIESAVRMVLAGDVLFLDDGTIEVGSRSNPAVTYRLEGTTCTCHDFAHKAPDGWCAHRISAGILKRVQEEMATPPVPGVPDVEAWPDNDPELDADDLKKVQVIEAPAPPALPEAPASCNVYVMIGGHKVQVTLRDTDEHRMLERLQVLLAQYPVPQPQAQPQAPAPQAAGQPQPSAKRYCPKDGAEMQFNQKDGRSWWSHRTDEGWCKGR